MSLTKIWNYSFLTFPTYTSTDEVTFTGIAKVTLAG
jgi:hypothetical protein